MNPVIPVVVTSLFLSAPQLSLETGKAGLEHKAGCGLIAQKYGGSDPHGPDPHGDDPHDEQHDPGLPANKEQKARKAPRDVYGGDIYNDPSPYPP